VLAGDADAGLGLRATADALDADFVPVGTETVTVHANPARADKPGVAALASAIADGEAFEALAGYDA
jgi:molybdate-binding protein